MEARRKIQYREKVTQPKSGSCRTSQSPAPHVTQTLVCRRDWRSTHPVGESAEQLEVMMNKADQPADRAGTAGFRLNSEIDARWRFGRADSEGWADERASAFRPVSEPSRHVGRAGYSRGAAAVRKKILMRRLTTHCTPFGARQNDRHVRLVHSGSRHKTI